MRASDHEVSDQIAKLQAQVGDLKNKLRETAQEGSRGQKEINDEMERGAGLTDGMVKGMDMLKGAILGAFSVGAVRQFFESIIQEWEKTKDAVGMNALSLQGAVFESGDTAAAGTIRSQIEAAESPFSLQERTQIYSQVRAANPTLGLDSALGIVGGSLEEVSRVTGGNVDKTGRIASGAAQLSRFGFGDQAALNVASKIFGAQGGADVFQRAQEATETLLKNSPGADPREVAGQVFGSFLTAAGQGLSTEQLLGAARRIPQIQERDIAARAKELEAGGMSPAAARRQAEQSLGGQSAFSIFNRALTGDDGTLSNKVFQEGMGTLRALDQRALAENAAAIRAGAPGYLDREKDRVDNLTNKLLDARIIAAKSAINSQNNSALGAENDALWEMRSSSITDAYGGFFGGAINLAEWATRQIGYATNPGEGIQPARPMNFTPGQAGATQPPPIVVENRLTIDQYGQTIDDQMRPQEGAD